eukprot:759278-Hanusia_phi.AAC.1
MWEGNCSRLQGSELQLLKDWQWVKERKWIVTREGEGNNFSQIDSPILLQDSWVQSFSFPSFSALPLIHQLASCSSIHARMIIVLYTRSGNALYVHRKLIKRDMRSAWIQRINAASREHGLKYCDFVHGMKLANVELNRKARTWRCARQANDVLLRRSCLILQ